MKLHYHPLSTYSRKAAIAIGLRGDPIELVMVDALSGSLKREPHLSLNPFGKMPALELDDGSSVFESTSIIEYLEEVIGPRRLLPDAHARKCRHFDRLSDFYLLDPIGKWFWDKTPEVFEKTKATTAKAWAFVEKELADGRPFICGDAITLADIGPAIAAHYATTEDVPLSEVIRAYRVRLEENPVVAASRDAALPFLAATKPRRAPKPTESASAG
ncbi:MAG: glutathione S-transferase family protein [Polyangiaceae bacterium]